MAETRKRKVQDVEENMNERKKKIIITKAIIIVVLGLVLGISCFFSKPIERALGIGKKETSYVEGAKIDENDLSVNFIDVGQGDSTLIILPDDTVMLIDAGKASAGDKVVSYLQEKDITTIDYFILTHSDEDHSGGAKKVFDEFDIKTVYRPFQISVTKETGEASESEDLEEYLDIYGSKINKISTAVYRNFITAAYNEEYAPGLFADVIVHSEGVKIVSKDSTKPFTFEFFAPLKIDDTPVSEHSTKTSGYPTKYYSGSLAESNNAASPIMLLEYKDNSFVFTGDAPEVVEEDFLQSIADKESVKERFSDVDVYSAGHHGSKTSSCQDFLNQIDPTYTVVSCGKDNSYGHPNQEFVDRVNSLTHRVEDYLLRTDTMGDISFGYYDGQLVGAENDLVIGQLIYVANKSGEGVVIYWWYIALGTFIVLSIVIISVKVSKNKMTTAKRFVKQTEKVTKKLKD